MLSGGIFLGVLELLRTFEILHAPVLQICQKSQIGLVALEV